MAVHFDLCAHLQQAKSLTPTDMIAMLVHACDIGTAVMPFDIFD